MPLSEREPPGGGDPDRDHCPQLRAFVARELARLAGELREAQDALAVRRLSPQDHADLGPLLVRLSADIAELRRAVCRLHRPAGESG